MPTNKISRHSEYCPIHHCVIIPVQERGRGGGIRVARRGDRAAADSDAILEMQWVGNHTALQRRKGARLQVCDLRVSSSARFGHAFKSRTHFILRVFNCHELIFQLSVYNNSALISGRNQVDSFLDQHSGAGIQHIGLYTEDIVSTSHTLRQAGVQFFSPPPAYYTEVWHSPEKSQNLFVNCAFEHRRENAQYLSLNSCSLSLLSFIDRSLLKRLQKRV